MIKYLNKFLKPMKGLGTLALLVLFFSQNVSAQASECGTNERIVRGNFLTPPATPGNQNAAQFSAATGGAWTLTSAATSGVTNSSANEVFWDNTGFQFFADGKTQNISQALTNVNPYGANGITPQIKISSFLARNSSGNGIDGESATFTVSYGGVTYASVTTVTGVGLDVLTINYQNGAFGNYSTTKTNSNISNWAITLPTTVPNNGNLVLGYTSATVTANNSDDFIIGNVSVNTCRDTDGDLVPDYVDADDDNDGITDVNEGFCSPTPSLLKSAYFAAQGAGAAGIPTVTFNAPATGTGKRTVILILSVERDHTPTPFGDNWESQVFTSPTTTNTALMPNVTFGGAQMDKRAYFTGFESGTNQITNARLSNVQYIYALPDNLIPTGSQTINLSNFTAGLSAGDEFNAKVLVYDNVRNIEFVSSTGFNQATTVTTTISGDPASPSQPAGTVASNNILLAFGGISNDNAFQLSSNWTPIFNNAVFNTNGTFATAAGNPAPPAGNSENDGISTFVASLTGVTGNQSLTITNNTAGALLGGFIMYRINGDVCTLRNTDGADNPDYLDLDSDNDGCFDAIEGDENVVSSQLNANGSINFGANGGVNASGIPNLVNAGGAADIGSDLGQGLGSSINSALSTCFVDAVNDVNQVPVGVTADGSVLTNDKFNETASVQSATYTNSAGIVVALPLGTTTPIYASAGVFAGAMTLNTNGTYTFVPAPAFTGNAPVNYTLLNSAGFTDAASLNIKVIPSANTTANDNPIAQNDTAATEINTSVSSNVLANDSDPDLGNTLTVTTASALTVSGVNTAGTPVANAGTLTLNTNGNYTFVPATGFTGSVNPVLYGISDGNGGSASAFLNITVYPNTGNVTYANDDANTAPLATTMTGNVKNNDTDPEGNATTVTAATVGVGGSAITIGTATAITNVGTVTLNANGTYTFVPLPAFVGTTSIIYTATDNGAPAATSQATLYLTSLNVFTTVCYNDPNTGTVGADTRHGITLLQRAGVTANNWPMVRKSAFTVLESNTKGFVITRATTAQINSIVSPQDGMMVFDTDVKCLKIYTTDSAVPANSAWSCYSTPACP